MNLGVGRVQNVTANNIFLKEKSFCEFIISAQGKSYASMPEYCDLYYGKKHDKKYFGQIITPINLLGLIQTDADEVLVENTLLKYVYEKQNQRLASYYINYFLCMWQYPIPSTKAASGRDMKIFKPYCLLLKMLLELYSINPKESYLSLYDFSYLFLEPENDMPLIDEINKEYAQSLIDTRVNRKAKGLSQENGSLIYIINTLAESDLLTKDGFLYPEAEDFYIGLKDKIGNRDTSLYKDLTLDSILTKDECIRMYRVITGECEYGTRSFVSKQEPSKIKDKYSIRELIKLTKGQYGNDKLVQFLKGK